MYKGRTFGHTSINNLNIYNNMHHIKKHTLINNFRAHVQITIYNM